MPSTLSTMLHTFIDMYERDPFALDYALSDDGPYFSYLEDDDNYVPPSEQLELLLSSSATAESEVLRKTLIRTSLGGSRYARFRDRLEKPKQPLEVSNKDMLEGLRSANQISRALVAAEFGLAENWTLKDLESALAFQEGLTYEEYKVKQAREIVISTITTSKLKSEILRFFADKLDSVADAIEKLDDTNFSLCVPESLRAPFRELHVNAVLGNYGTVSILCGAVLEHSLRDLLPTDSTLKDAIEEAKNCGLLQNHAIRSAYKIADSRNRAVHGKIRFDGLTSDDAWALIDQTRILTKWLYSGRMDKGS